MFEGRPGETRTEEDLQALRAASLTPVRSSSDFSRR